jgi:hypothetical protein
MMARRDEMDEALKDNRERGRYEMEIDGKIVFADYHLRGTTLVIPHVEAAPALRGTGAASRLMRAVMEKARGAGWRVVPLCGYAAAWIRRHKDYHDLLG